MIDAKNRANAAIWERSVGWTTIRLVKTEPIADQRGSGGSYEIARAELGPRLKLARRTVECSDLLPMVEDQRKDRHHLDLPLFSCKVTRKESTSFGVRDYDC